MQLKPAGSLPRNEWRMRTIASYSNSDTQDRCSRIQPMESSGGLGHDARESLALSHASSQEIHQKSVELPEVVLTATSQHMKDLFVGITSWNSAWFLDDCLRSLRATTDRSTTEIAVFDNCSTDNSVSIARSWGARVGSGNRPQANALNWLFRRSKANTHC